MFGNGYVVAATVRLWGGDIGRRTLESTFAPAWSSQPAASRPQLRRAGTCRACKPAGRCDL